MSMKIDPEIAKWADMRSEMSKIMKKPKFTFKLFWCVVGFPVVLYFVGYKLLPNEAFRIRDNIKGRPGYGELIAESPLDKIKEYVKNLR